MTINEREQAVAKYGDESFPHCDAFESGCTCDLCRDDELFVITADWEAEKRNTDYVRGTGPIKVPWSSND